MFRLAFIVIFYFITPSANAQSLYAGALLGANSSNLTGEDVGDFSSRLGFRAGAVLKIPISPRFAVQPELVYSNQGFDSSADGVFTQGIIDYLTIPVLVDLNIAGGLSVQFGPQVGINIQTQITEPGNTENESILDADRLDSAFALGLQFELPSGIFLQGRYTFGITDLNTVVQIKNSVASLALGYFLID